MVSKEAIITGAMIILITYTLGLSLVSQAFPATQISHTLSSSGTIQTTADIAVYSTSSCSTPLTSLTWGTLEPGGNQSIICYIRNEGNTPLTLSMYVENWNPESLETSNYLALSWNYDSTPINRDEVVQVTFTLTASPDIEGIDNFNFDISVVGTGQ